MATKVRYRTIDWDLRIPLCHRGDGSNCELGHVRADLVGLFKVGFPMEPGRENQRLVLAPRMLMGALKYQNG